MWEGQRGEEGAAWGGKGSWQQWCGEREVADGSVPFLSSLDSGGLWMTFFLPCSAWSQCPTKALQAKLMGCVCVCILKQNAHFGVHFVQLPHRGSERANDLPKVTQQTNGST